MTDFVELIEPGMTVFVPGSSGEPTAALEALARLPERCEGVHFIVTFVPGINTFDLGSLGPGARFTSFFMHPSLRVAQAEGRLDLIDLPYSGLIDWFAQQEIDIALAQVSGDSRAGCHSLGPAVEFAPLVLQTARKRVAVCNAHTPWLNGSVSLPTDGFDLLLEADTALPQYPDPKPTEIYGAIGATVAELIPNGATLQVGLGQAPAAVLDALHSHRNLGFHSGIFFDSLLRLIDAGAMGADQALTSGMAAGSPGFYRALSDYPQIRFTDVSQTHPKKTLHGIAKFFTINSAIEVDLEGNVNAQFLDGRRISGPGGLPDYAAAGHHSKGGASIIVLPSTDRRGLHSRIINKVENVTVSGELIDFVITEHGCASLAGLDGLRRAEKIRTLAAPGFRDQLGKTDLQN